MKHMQCVLLCRQQASLGNTVIPLVDHDGPGHVRSADIANEASTLLALLPYSPEITPYYRFPGFPADFPDVRARGSENVLDGFL